MPIPNADRAFVDDAQLLNYCLEPPHLHGCNKARRFEERLGGLGPWSRSQRVSRTLAGGAFNLAICSSRALARNNRAG
jgi:hypothetical protein